MKVLCLLIQNKVRYCSFTLIKPGAIDMVPAKKPPENF